jgi:imidazolonepropionase-like amidohydrolase
MAKLIRVILGLVAVLLGSGVVQAASELSEAPRAPERAEGEGPFERLILRGVTLIDGTGAPARGPVDIVIEGNRITRIRSVGAPGVPIDPERRPQAGPDDKVLELDGHYVLPGFVDLHGHLGGSIRSTPAEYVLKLWMAHGITTISDPGSGNGLDWMLWHKAQSAANEITAPRIEAYSRFGQDHEGPIATPEEARAWVRGVAERGADGLKLFGLRPDLMRATIEQAAELGLKTTCHHAQLNVVWQDALDSARMGLTSMQHWYGLPEAMFTDRISQDYPAAYDYNNEQDRFSEAGRLWAQAAPPWSDKWNEVMDELVDLDFTIVPTFVAYEATRDLSRMMRAEWHEKHTLPALWRFFLPDRLAHASYWFYWGTEEEVAWKRNYQLWMTFINEFKNRGGRVAIGSDSGYSFNLYGFSHIREMELLREAGFHPLEVIRSATLMGAQGLGLAHEIGTVEPGKLADLVVVDENPLANLKVLYGIGALKLSPENEVERVGSVRYTIKDGIVFDARQLLADVRAMVQAEKDAEGFEITIPGLPY